MNVKEERTGWRDQGISMRHRAWGYDCPALDIDFLMLEYDHGKAAALVEFKNENADRVRLEHPSMRAVIGLADNSAIPFFVVRYASDFTWYEVHPANVRAHEIVPNPTRLTEPEWIELLYFCRDRKIPDGLLETMI
jgi:hypothetical protein